MGFQDRDYYREGSQSAYITSVVVKLIIINGIVFLSDLFFGGPEHKITNLLAVHSDTIVRPLYWWQFITAGFVHAPPDSAGGFSHIFFNMLGLYCFGMPLEERYGRKEFLRFYLVAIVLGFLVWSGAHYAWLQTLPAGLAEHVSPATCLGASGGVTATVLLFCLLFPRATVLAWFLFPIPAWLMGMVIVLLNLFGTAQNSPRFGGVAYDVHLAGAAFALAYWYFGWNLRRFPGWDDVTRVFTGSKKWFKPRPPLRVHDPEQYYEDLDAEADRLLAKVSRDGEASLTPQERRTLEDYSRRMRQKLR